MYAYIDSGYDGIVTSLDTDVNVIFLCDADTEASCTGYYGGNATVLCKDGGHCQMDCGEQQCAFQVMDATNTLSLNLTCDGQYSCAGSTILCPTTDDAICFISCPGDDDTACDSMSIVVDNENLHYDSLQIDCISECYNIKTTVRVAEIYDIDINCQSRCDNMFFSVEADVVDDIVIYCNAGYGCQQSSWTSKVANLYHVRFVCGEYNACEDSYIGFSDAKSLNLYCGSEV